MEQFNIKVNGIVGVIVEEELVHYKVVRLVPTGVYGRPCENLVDYEDEKEDIEFIPCNEIVGYTEKSKVSFCVRCGDLVCPGDILCDDCYKQELYLRKKDEKDLV